MRVPTLGLILNLLVVPVAFATDAMPVVQENALVNKYCAVCHTDAIRNGGLSLQHFDAANVPPSLAAMMLSKLTSGTFLRTVQASSSDPSAAAVVARKMKSGAMGAAGIPVPDNATIDGFVNALAAQSAGADRWSASRTSTTQSVSIFRETPNNSGGAEGYRLLLSCAAATHQGEMQLAWSPAPKNGTVTTSVDTKAPRSYQVEGSETMGNGSRVVTVGLAAINLSDSLPRQTLSVNAAPNEALQFPFADLPGTIRESLQPCFTAK